MKKHAFLLSLLLVTVAQFVFSQTKPAAAGDLYATDKIQEIKISFKQSNWQYILDSLRFNDNGTLMGLVEVNGQKFENARVRYRGFKSFVPGSARNPFHIDLGGEGYQGYKRLRLSNTLRDPSFIREVLGFEIARTYMPAPKANFARLTINGKFYGLMANIEGTDEEPFKNRYFASSDNAYFKANQDPQQAPSGCKQNIYGSLEYDQHINCYENNFEKLSEHGTKELMELSRILNEDTDKIEGILNVDATLWMHAFNNLIVNLNSYSGQHSVNYYLYQDDDGRFSPIVWDLNLAFGSFKNTGIGSDLKLKGLQELDPLLYATSTTKPLVSKLLENPMYRKAYLAHHRTMLQDWFISGKFEKRATQLQSLIRNSVIEDPGKTYTIADFDASLSKTVGKKSKIPGLMELMSKRTAFLKAHPELAVFPPDISEVKVEGRQPLSNQRVHQFKISAKVDKFPTRVDLYYRLDKQGSFAVVTMKDDGKNDDGKPGNNVFGATIVPQNGEQSIEYYIVAENPSMVGYSPANYMWERHSSTLEALNK